MNWKSIFKPKREPLAQVITRIRVKVGKYDSSMQILD